MKLSSSTGCVLFAALLWAPWASAATNVACVGDSITYGYGLNANQTYPVDLQALLGTAYVVHNFGHNGATMLKSGDNPYWNLPEFPASDAFAPNVVVIMLGTNDSKPGNWTYASQFEGDYTAMVQHYRDLGAKVYVAVPPPAQANLSYWQVDSVVPHVRNVAAAMSAPLIDVYAAMTGHPEDFADDVHPNAAGAQLLAQTVFNALTGAGGAGTGGAGGAASGGSAGSSANTGGTNTGGTSTGSGGTTANTGGTSAAGTGTGGAGATPNGNAGSAGSSNASSSSSNSGCGCRTASRPMSSFGLTLLAALVLAARSRRRARITRS